MNFRLWLENTEVKFPTLLIDKIKLVYDIIKKAPDYESARQELADLGKENGMSSLFGNSESIYKLLSKTNKPFTQQEKIEYIPKFMNVIRLCMQKFKNLTNDGFYYFAPNNVEDTTRTSSKYHIQISPQDIEVEIPELIGFMSRNQNLFYQFKFAKTHHTNFNLFDPAEWGRSSPINDVWKPKMRSSTGNDEPRARIEKGKEKLVKGTDKILGFLEGITKDDEIHVSIMTVRKPYQKNTITAKMIDALKKDYPEAKIKFDEPSDEGQKFIDKRYPEAEITNKAMWKWLGRV